MPAIFNRFDQFIDRSKPSSKLAHHQSLLKVVIVKNNHQFSVREIPTHLLKDMVG
tara:strand:+ start:11035 stop:11199 length:165 start_codon:yes stop_codon:yes gene_type:complete